MPSRPPFDGVAVPSCAGIRTDGTTIRAIDALTGVDGKSLFPIFNQWGSTKYSPPATSIMGGEDNPAAAPPMPSARVSPFDRLAKGWMAPLPACHGAAMPLRPPRHDQ
jgi:hypothetical protein